MWPHHHHHHHRHHHHWLDSPWWALAFLRSFVHSSLLRATLFQFLTSNILMAWSAPSSHRSFGLPTLLTPSGLRWIFFKWFYHYSFRVASADLNLVPSSCTVVSWFCSWGGRIHRQADRHNKHGDVTNLLFLVIKKINMLKIIVRMCKHLS